MRVSELIDDGYQQPELAGIAPPAARPLVPVSNLLSAQRVFGIVRRQKQSRLRPRLFRIEAAASAATGDVAGV